MNILIIHNLYSTRGGEESVVEFQKELFESKGHKVYLYTRHYNEMNGWILGKSWGTVTSIFNRKSRRDLDKIIIDFKPDVAILHNLFPIISPSIIPYLSKKGIKVCQVVHNYRMFCPIGILYTKHQICHKCLNFGREFNCTMNKCNGSLLQSLSYSIRAYFVRKLNFYKNVDRFIVLSQFQKNLFIKNGFQEDKIEIIPNAYSPKTNIDFSELNLEEKVNIGFVGRLTHEKGFYDFVDLAKLAPEYNFCVAGDFSQLPENFVKPSNLHFIGFIDSLELVHFYKKLKVLIVPSRWYEIFGLVIIEAFANRTPVIGSNIAGIKDIIENGKNGYLVEVGDIESMKKLIIDLFQNDHKYNEMTENAFNTFITKYSSDIYYKRMMFAISNIPQPTNTDY